MRERIKPPAFVRNFYSLDSRNPAVYPRLEVSLQPRYAHGFDEDRREGSPRARSC